MKNQITCTEHNRLYYPDLALPKQTNYPLGKYANLWIDFMKKHRRGTYPQKAFVTTNPMSSQLI